MPKGLHERVKDKNKEMLPFVALLIVADFEVMIK